MRSRGQETNNNKYNKRILKKMAKCAICNKRIDVTFLNKIIGTHVKDSKGKRHTVCFECQKKFNKQEILGKIK
jgi:hypothetical protein